MATEERKFLRYYSQFKDKIYTYFLYRVNFNRTLAEDLTSEVFLKAFKNFETFDQAKSFQAWIYKIAKNHLCNYYRTLNREVGLTEAKKYSCDFKAKLEAKLDIETILKKIKKLDEYYSEVLLLRYADGLSNSEIAAVLEKEEGAVRTQISRATKELKILLAK